MIFVSVGTSKYPFPRLVRAVDELAAELDERVYVQAGATLDAYTPANTEYTDFVSREEYERLVEEARVFVTHAGTGSIITALRAGTPFVLFPRDGDRGEHRDDQQLETASGWESRGGVSVARTAGELRRRLREDDVARPDYAGGDADLEGTIADLLARKARSGRGGNDGREGRDEGGGDLTVVCPCPPGGHLTQLLELDGTLSRYDVTYLTWDETIAGSVDGVRLVDGYHLEELPDPATIRDFAVTTGHIVRVLLELRPDVVVSTGGGGFVVSAAYLAKLLGADVIHVESLTRFESASTSGRLLYPIADHFFVQHPAVRSDYGSKVQYEGRLF